MVDDKLKLLFYVEHFRLIGAGLEDDAVKLCQALAGRGCEVHVLADDAESFDDIIVHTDGLKKAVDVAAGILPDLTIDWGFYYPADIHYMEAGTHRGYIPYSLDACRGVGRLFKKLAYGKSKHRAIIAKEQTMLRNPLAHFLANSHQTAGLAIADGANPDRMTVRHQSVDLERFHPEHIREHRAAARREWKLDENDVAFIFVAHNLRLKNLDLLLRVFRRLPPEANARLIVVGKRRPKCRADWLVYAGTTDTIERFYAGADVIVHPTYFDSCANVVLEAMSCGLPVLVSDTAGINEIVRDGTDGQVLAVRGKRREVEERWRQPILELARDPELRRRQGLAARQTAETRDYNKFIDWFEEYLQKVYQQKTAGQ